MQLSILMGTNRADLLACSRIAQACSWAGSNIEVIIRDNSGDAKKRALLPHFRRENCNVIIAEPCDALTNISEILKLAKGDYLFVVADDDFCFDHAIAVIPGMIAQIGDDRSVVGITGAYAVELSQGSALVEYKNIDSDDAAMRVAGFLSYVGPNIMHYAPVRRDVFERIFGFMNTMPAFFSFHDQIISLLYLLNGKFVHLKRLLYLYEMGPWQEAESAHERDLSYYKSAGLDPAINLLHWFMCGFEGAVLIRNGGQFPDHSLALRQIIADRWFSTMFLRFKNPRSAYGSVFKGEAEKLHAKLLTSTGQLSFEGMLAEICGLMALCSADLAQRYFDFWLAAVNKRVPAIQSAPSATRASA